LPAKNAGVRMAASGAKLAAVDSASQMQIRSPLIHAIAAFLLTAPAVAQVLPQPSAPYAPVGIVLPAPSSDPSFTAFRAAITAAAKSRLYADLEALVQPQSFFWDRDFANAYDPKKPSVDNLAMAVALEQRDGIGWDKLASFAEEKTLEALDSRPGVFCAPARPAYDMVDFSRLLNATYTSASDWSYPLADGAPVRAAARANAPAIGQLMLQFVRHLGLQRAEDAPAGPGNSQASSQANPWVKVALPDGKIGYVEPGHLSSLAVERLCYVRDMVAGWRIAGYIGKGN
jgi:hypothetical protein